MDGEHPEWLPEDWKVCVRVRSSGKKDKYYNNPSNGLKFNSKPDVLRYLKSTGKDLKLKQLNKIDFKRTIVEKLPSGWIKEIRIKRKGGKTRRDPYYIDPVSGRHFRSIQEVNRYLETKDSEKAESKGDDPCHTSEELGDHSKSSTAGAKEQRLIDQRADKICTENESIKSEGAVENINPPETNALGQREKQKDSVAEDRQQETVVPRNKRKKANSKWMNGLPRRTSKRLAQVNADPPLEAKTSNGARETARLSDEAEVNTIENVGKTEINTSGDSVKEKEPTNLPSRDLSSREEHEAVGVDFKEDEKNEKHLESSLNDLLMDPCIEFAIKTLTGAIPIEDVNKVHDSSVASLASSNETSGSSSVLPFGDIWADPCFEFAVKMLTSEIPVEDGSQFQISFQQPLSSSGASGCNSIAK